FMKTPILFAALAINSLFAMAQTPVLTHVFDIRAEIGSAINGGQNPHGVRVTIPITGGVVTGKVNGKVIPGGADYQLVNPEQQRSELQAIYTIMTSDSVAIHVCNEGINRFAPDDSYFMTSPKFECDINSPYNWLNNRIFVCRPVGFEQNAITLRVWMAE
ncbi:MAG: DUF3237 family protein, partial [Muribaculaceae bacterium]|nr:DUF3237 family protein [Muribaculaceae bacterium]